MKLGLDIHGVITANPNFFARLSSLAVLRGFEVHIITGSMLTASKLEELRRCDVEWTHLFSISDYHKKLGTDMTFTDPENPWIEHRLWDKTKAKYCADHGISFHIDDTQRYGEYFETPFALYDHTNARLDWHHLIEKHSAFLLTSPEEVLDHIERVVKDTRQAEAY